MKIFRFFPSAVTVLAACSPAFAGDLAFQRHVINDQTDYSAAAVIDVDHDGQLDIVCGGDWYQAPNWERHFVAEIPRIRDRPDGFAHLEFDVNRDGWLDVITVNYRSRSIKWMEHPGASLGPWKTHLAVEPGPMETGRLVDVDGDGQLDLLPNGAKFAAWWEFRWSDDGPSEPAWIRHDLPDEAGGHGLGFGDVDGDGRGDLVGQHGWLQAPADARNGEWIWHAEYSLERACIPMIVADADDDGDSDIIWSSAHGFGVYWLEQVRDEAGKRSWTRHAIDTSWSQGHSPLWVDLDGDGRKELVTGKRYMAHGGSDPGEYDPIAIYRYQFDPATRSWHRWTVSELGQRVGVGLDPKVADIDRDGDLDLVTSGRSGLYWLENLGPVTSVTQEVPLPRYRYGEPLLMFKDAESNHHPVVGPEDWGRRRHHIVSAVEKAIGSLPDSTARVPLEVAVDTEKVERTHTVQRIGYRIDRDRKISASLLTPNAEAQGDAAGIVCLFDSPTRGLKVARQLVERGFVCLVPQHVDRAVRDRVWQTMRATDLLQASAHVHGERIGLVADADNSILAILVAAIDQRSVATWADAIGFPGTMEDSSPAELFAAVAPRALAVGLPPDRSVRVDMQAQFAKAAAVFELRNATQKLERIEKSDSEDNDEAIVTWFQKQFRR